MTGFAVTLLMALAILLALLTFCVIEIKDTRTSLKVVRGDLREAEEKILTGGGRQIYLDQKGNKLGSSSYRDTEVDRMEKRARRYLGESYETGSVHVFGCVLSAYKHPEVVVKKLTLENLNQREKEKKDEGEQTQEETV